MPLTHVRSSDGLSGGAGSHRLPYQRCGRGMPCTSAEDEEAGQVQRNNAGAKQRHVLWHRHRRSHVMRDTGLLLRDPWPQVRRMPSQRHPKDRGVGGHRLRMHINHPILAAAGAACMCMRLHVHGFVPAFSNTAGSRVYLPVLRPWLNVTVRVQCCACIVWVVHGPCGCRERCAGVAHL